MKNRYGNLLLPIRPVYYLHQISPNPTPSSPHVYYRNGASLIIVIGIIYQLSSLLSPPTCRTKKSYYPSEPYTSRHPMYDDKTYWDLAGELFPNLYDEAQTPEFAKSTPAQIPCTQCHHLNIKCVGLGANQCMECEHHQRQCSFAHHNPNVSPNSKKNKIDPPPMMLKRTFEQSQQQPPQSFPKLSFYVGATLYAHDTQVVNAIFRAKGLMRNLRVQRIDLLTGENKRSAALLRNVAPLVHFLLCDDQTPQLFSQLTKDVDAVERLVAPHGQNLVNLYFRVVHPTYPILHKLVFLEKYQRTPREFTLPLLVGVYVLALQWWDHDPQLSRYPKPSLEQLLKVGMTNFLLEVLKRPKLLAVQAGLLLLQCKHVIDQEKLKHADVNDADYSDWVLCSQVVALAEEMGLGLDCGGWQLPKWERLLRKRIAWGIYIEDKWLALKNGRPLHISPQNWAVPLISERDFPERSGLSAGTTPGLETSPQLSNYPDIELGKKIFVQLALLSRIVGDILLELYSFKAMQEVTGLSQVLSFAKPLQIRLKQWYQELPPELQMNAVAPQKLCANGTLQLAYFAAELTLHRKIILILWQEQRGGNHVPPQYISACHDAAKTRLTGLIKFVQDLKPQHIHLYWHLLLAANFTLIGTFAALLYCLAPLVSDREFYRTQANNYRWVLKVCSKGFDQAGQALAEITLMYDQIPGLSSEEHLFDSTARPAPPPRLQLDMLFAGHGEIQRLNSLPTNIIQQEPELLPKELIQQQMNVHDKSSH